MCATARGRNSRCDWPETRTGTSLVEPASHRQQHHRKKEEALLHARLIFALLQTLVFVNTTAPRPLAFPCTYLAERVCILIRHFLHSTRGAALAL
jgi:hypothetical protein